ncbi:MAG: hypothetical protein DWQ45_13245 [Planctomycetota bacterium]|nr:MAG: hypothetical protein DWQ29_17880 [Planctomycetota bacterium]REK34413.1 MAG: hypothetical protein DWQ45_13245 [Planctomycetota bacterium]
MLPVIERGISHRLRHLNGQAREELTADAVALAYEMFVALVRRGKADLAYATPLATYACRQALAGRHLGSSLNVRDVTSHYCQSRKGVRVQRLDRFDRDEDTWREILIEDRTANPADIAAVRIDFQDWLASLSRRKRRIAETLAAGERTSKAARLFRVSAGRISQLRQELCDSWAEFQGEPVLSLA